MRVVAVDAGHLSASKGHMGGPLHTGPYFKMTGDADLRAVPLLRPRPLPLSMDGMAESTTYAFKIMSAPPPLAYASLIVAAKAGSVVACLIAWPLLERRLNSNRSLITPFSRNPMVNARSMTSLTISPVALVLAFADKDLAMDVTMVGPLYFTVANQAFMLFLILIGSI